MSRAKICISIDRDVLEKVRTAALKDDRSLSYMMNLFIKNGMARKERMRRLIKRNPGRTLLHRNIQEVI